MSGTPVDAHAPHAGSRWATPGRMVGSVGGRCPACRPYAGLENWLVGVAVATVLVVYRPVKGCWLWATWAAGWVHRDGEDPEGAPASGAPGDGRT